MTSPTAATLTYSDYLHLEALLTSQVPRSAPPHHDELTFIVQHQTSELWLKLVLHEVRAAQLHLAADEHRRAIKCLARVKAIQRTLNEQWSVLSTLTPPEYVAFRGSLGSSSGFQSYQYRAVEFALGAKDASMLAMFKTDARAGVLLESVLDAPSLYDSLLAHLARGGHDVPRSVLQRDVRRPHEFTPELVPIFQTIYEGSQSFWHAYELCEQFVDLDENFQLWRFRHLKTVERIIGRKRGTGGSGGVPFLEAALGRSFFPELLAVRTEIGV